MIPIFHITLSCRNTKKSGFRSIPYLKNDPEIFAATGGWHIPGQESDWHELTKAKLLITTIRDSEPWVEAFQMPDGDYKVFQRIT